MQFSVYLYGPTCRPLRVSNIDLELYDTATNAMLHRQVSAQIGSPQEWGAQLVWNPPVGNAVEILCKDPTLTYSGNAVLGINGKLSGRLDMILDRLPAPVSGGGGGGGGPQRSGPSGSGPRSLVEWIDASQTWSPSEKTAVRRLASNYMAAILPRKAANTLTPELNEVARNWEGALERVGIAVEMIGEERQAMGEEEGVIA